ncbi:MAG TPA: metallopeptidase TldD-related protein [Candidatus Omnitrophota bacterium]|nr:metallopeptidase TldD-related protein [Candidatus Omnitrophota bacterium]
MIHPDQIQEKLSPFTRTKEADKTGITFLRTSLQVSRFANSLIHQHMNDETQIIYFRALCNGRLGIASTNSLAEHNLKETFKKALHIAKLKIDCRLKRDIPSFRPLKTIANKVSPKTIYAPASSRAKILRDIFLEARDLKIGFAGNFYNGLTQLAVLYPGGLMNYQDHSFCGVKFIASHNGSSGYAANVDYDIDRLNPAQTADKAIEKCLLGLKKTALKPGRYDVILEPPATAELILWLNYIGFGAKSFLEETSFLCGKLGERLTGKKVEIYDYGRDKNSFILPFDFEGSRRQKISLIKNGIAQKPLTDSYYAKLLKIRNTGHANFPDDTEGPLGYNLIMRNGRTAKDEMFKSTKQAVLITRFHYVNGFLDPRKAQMTGMTRDGTFLVENGKIKCGIKDMRFNESILEAFSRINHISREREIIADPLESLGSVYAPSLYIKGFNFIS